MSHHVPGPPDYDVVMTEQVPGLNGPKMLGRHKPTAPKGKGQNKCKFSGQNSTPFHKSPHSP